MLDSHGFALWADGYDAAVGLADESGEYPFAGYNSVLGRIYRLVLEGSASTLPEGERPTILDLGFGTATLTAKLYERGCTVFGQDFSERMIGIAAAKMPDAALCRGDLASGLCASLTAERYDAIIATYSLHHLNPDQKVSLIRSLLPLLKENGQILIGDVAFESKTLLEQCRSAVGDGWDGDEFYFTFDEMKACFPEITFEAHSHCAGVFILRK